MAELKTKPTEQDVDAFIAGLSNPVQKQECTTLRDLLTDVTHEPAKMWGASIIGFGSYHYTYKSGREGDWMLTGFSPRKNNMTMYVMDGFDAYGDLLEKLGPHTTSVGCLYIKRLDQIDLDVLKTLLTRSVAHVKSGDFLL